MDRFELTPGRYSIVRSSFIWPSYTVTNAEGQTIYTQTSWKGTKDKLAGRGIRIEETLTGRTIYYCCFRRFFKVCEEGFYNAAMESLGETYVSDVPQDFLPPLRNCLSANATPKKKQIWDFLKPYEIPWNHCRPGEQLQAFLKLPEGLFLVFYYPWAFTCKKVRVVRDQNLRKVFHLVDSNTGVRKPISLRVSRKLDGQTFMPVLYAAVFSLDFLDSGPSGADNGD